MNIHINSETEQLIQTALASGNFANAEEFVAEMARRWEGQVQAENAGRENAFDAFSRLGVIGCMKDGPSDLATNPKHMEGFGR